MVSHLIEAQPRSSNTARVASPSSQALLPNMSASRLCGTAPSATSTRPSRLLCQFGIVHVRSEHKRSQRGRGSDTTTSEKLGPLCGSTPRRRASACTIGFSSTLQNRRRQDQTRGQNHETRTDQFVGVCFRCSTMFDKIVFAHSHQHLLTTRARQNSTKTRGFCSHHLIEAIDEIQSSKMEVGRSTPHNCGRGRQVVGRSSVEDEALSSLFLAGRRELQASLDSVG